MKSNIILLENAIDFKKFNSLSKKKNNSNKINLVTVGRLYKHKNQIFLIDVLKNILLKNKNATLTIIGNGPEIELIKERALKLNVYENIKFLGLVNDLENELPKYNFLLHSALYEPFGLVLLEGMAAGLPVLTLDGGGNRNIIEDKKNGYIFRKQDPKLFANQILELFNNEENYNHITKNGINTAKSYDIKDYVLKLIKIYNS